MEIDGGGLQYIDLAIEKCPENGQYYLTKG